MKCLVYLNDPEIPPKCLCCTPLSRLESTMFGDEVDICLAHEGRAVKEHRCGQGLKIMLGDEGREGETDSHRQKEREKSPCAEKCLS